MLTSDLMLSKLDMIAGCELIIVRKVSCYLMKQVDVEYSKCDEVESSREVGIGLICHYPGAATLTTPHLVRRSSCPVHPYNEQGLSSPVPSSYDTCVIAARNHRISPRFS